MILFNLQNLTLINNIMNIHNLLKYYNIRITLQRRYNAKGNNKRKISMEK